jgi:hypothetical protein
MELRLNMRLLYHQAFARRKSDEILKKLLTVNFVNDMMVM